MSLAERLPDTAGLDAETRGALDAAVAEVAAGLVTWLALPLRQRAALLTATHAAIAGQAEAWALRAAEIKGLDPASPLVGEEWISGPYAALTGAAALAHSIADLASGRSPIAHTRVREAPGGRVALQVLPHTAHEAVLLHGFHAEVWLRPGVTAQQAVERAGLAQRTPAVGGGVGLVLGAGNITSIAPLDVLSELVAHNRVSVLKLNPTMAGMLEVYLAALRPLVSAGLLRIVQGGAEEGGYLARHRGIGHVHITGSAVSHDAIVWGRGADAAARKRAGEPLLTKPITSELGGVSPVIVVPGRWSRRDLRYQAEHVATQRLHNGGYNCIAGQVVIVGRDWPQKQAFLDELQAALERAPQRPAWYPGSDDRLAAGLQAYPGARRIAGGSRLLVDATADPAAMCSTEYFSPVLGVVEVAGSGRAFLDAAVRTANDELVGTLGANVLATPADIRAVGDGFRAAIAALRYGTIAVNSWTGVGFLTATAPWGAFPGHTIDDVQSGIGTVHNALLIDDVERTVVTGPFRPFPRSVLGGEFALFPKPPWFVTARSAAAAGRLLTGFAAAPSWLKMPAVFLAAFRA